MISIAWLELHFSFQGQRVVRHKLGKKPFNLRDLWLSRAPNRPYVPPWISHLPPPSCRPRRGAGSMTMARCCIITYSHGEGIEEQWSSPRRGSRYPKARRSRWSKSPRCPPIAELPSRVPTWRKAYMKHRLHKSHSIMFGCGPLHNSIIETRNSYGPMARETANCPFTRKAPSQKITSPPKSDILCFSSCKSRKR